MHRLNRNIVVMPTGLTPTTPTRRFHELSGAEKLEIRNALLTVQGQRCAYCERRTGFQHDDGHVEHFRSQSGHPHLETDWNNLFWSCNDEKTCGKHKDKCVRAASSPKRSFNPPDLLKPCTDDPEHFMFFVSDGAITSQTGLGADELRRYNETLRVFQLADSPFLRESRKDAVKPYIGILGALVQAGADVVRNYISGELATLESTPFATAIRHFLQSNLL
jgi:uncharacterized protein (TIGR02646 family)